MLALIFLTTNTIADVDGIELQPNDYVIHLNPGGALFDFYEEVEQSIKKYPRIIVDGLCASACTLYLSHPNICSTEKGKFWFHAPWISVPKKPFIFRHGIKIFVDRDRVVRSLKLYTILHKYIMHTYYPWNVNKIIIEQGGLTRTWIKLKGTNIIQKCT